MNIHTTVETLVQVFPVLRWLYEVPAETAAVAIGIGVHPNGKEASARSAANAIVAYLLQKHAYAKHLVLLSLNKHQETGLDETCAMRRSLPRILYNLVMDPGVLADGQTDNTFLNMLRLRGIVRELSLKCVVICAQKRHARRCGWTARWALRGLGVKVVVLYVRGEYDKEATGFFEKPFGFWCREKFVWVYAVYYMVRNWNLPFQYEQKTGR